MGTGEASPHLSERRSEGFQSQGYESTVAYVSYAVPRPNFAFLREEVLLVLEVYNWDMIK